MEFNHVENIRKKSGIVNSDLFIYVVAFGGDPAN